MIEGSTTEKNEGSKSGDWGEDDEAMKWGGYDMGSHAHKEGIKEVGLKYVHICFINLPRPPLCRPPS